MSVTSGRELRPEVLKAMELLRSNKELQPIRDPPLREIDSVQFGLIGPEEMMGLSVCNITQSKISKPFDNTVYDERMGALYKKRM